MTAYLVFNELSASEAATRIEATRIFDEFFRIVVDSKIKGRKALVAPPQFRQIQLCPGHSIGRLLANATHWTADRRLRIKILLDRCASYEDCAGGDGELDSGDVEYRCAGRTAQGLATALLVDGLALSLQSSEQWDAAKVDVEKAWVAAGDIHFRILPVRHASKAEHLQAHQDWLQKQEPAPPANGAELWQTRSNIFPSIDFCESAGEQIRALPGNQPTFRSTLRGLRDLQNYCETWDTGNFDIHRLIRASGESKSTMQMYSAERTFMCPDGQFRTFEWHLKRGHTRIHFFDFPAAKRILIGYIGPHLRISSE